MAKHKKAAKSKVAVRKRQAAKKKIVVKARNAAPRKAVARKPVRIEIKKQPKKLTPKQFAAKLKADKKEAKAREKAALKVGKQDKLRPAPASASSPVRQAPSTSRVPSGSVAPSPPSTPMRNPRTPNDRSMLKADAGIARVRGSPGSIPASTSSINAEAMAATNFFAHADPADGSSSADRVSAAGYEWSKVAENISAGQAAPAGGGAPAPAGGNAPR